MKMKIRKKNRKTKFTVFSLDNVFSIGLVYGIYAV